MTMIVIGSVRSAGATTVAMTLAGLTSRGVLVEADADGGILALRYGLGREPGLVTLAASRQASGQAILDHAQRIPGGLPVVVAPESPERVSQLLRTAGDRLATLLIGVDEHDVVVDAGRLGPSSPAMCLAQVAPVALILARPQAEELVAASERVAAIGSGAGLVLVGTGPYGAPEVTTQLGCPVFGTIADDARSAKVLAAGGSTKALNRSPLVRSVRTLARSLAPLVALAEGRGQEPRSLEVLA